VPLRILGSLWTNLERLLMVQLGSHPTHFCRSHFRENAPQLRHQDGQS